MSYTQSFGITARSAVATLLEVDARARRDVNLLIAILTHPEALKTYRTLWNLLQIVWAIAVYLFLLLQREIDREVESYIDQEPGPIVFTFYVSEPIAADKSPEPIALLPAATEAEPEVLMLDEDEPTETEITRVTALLPAATAARRRASFAAVQANIHEQIEAADAVTSQESAKIAEVVATVEVDAIELEGDTDPDAVGEPVQAEAASEVEAIAAPVTDLEQLPSPVIRQMCIERNIPVRPGRGRIGEVERARMITALSATA